MWNSIIGGNMTLKRFVNDIIICDNNFKFKLVLQEPYCPDLVITECNSLKEFKADLTEKYLDNIVSAIKVTKTKIIVGIWA